MLERSWPAEGVTRVPYWVYQDPEIYAEEQVRIWRGNTWSYLCLEAELPEPQCFVTAVAGIDGHDSAAGLQLTFVVFGLFTG